MEKHLGQLILTGVPGTTLDPDTARLIKSINPGGYILFGRNIQSPCQLRKLIDDLRDISPTEPVITIDQEGGRVSRLRLIGSEPPSAQQLRDKNENTLIKRHGELTGEMLRLFGFNLDLCPVLDFSPDDNADNSLKGRCYGSSPEQVISNATIFNAALRKAGILSCGKHFPGYTYASCDAHEQLPVVKRTRSQWEATEAAPFRALLPDLDSIMVCHTHYPFFDPDRPRWPASLSHNVITETLRKQLGFNNGLVITDDLDMGAILNEITFEDTIKNAIHAGNDMVMICHRTEMVQQAYKALEGIPSSQVAEPLERISIAKQRLCTPSPFSIEAFKETDSKIWDLRVKTLGEEKASQLSIEDGKRSPVETY
ncbi:MAG: glycoside hydrolase family 3 protein [Verrucomicrobiaceae bacterium]|nr:glycoside hydrolase family 3 protein [Verrucomicrobiaceae bacterium]